jgi:diacylglycerol kinase
MIKIKKCLNSFRFAIKGIFQFFRYENNARIHLLATILVIVLGILFKLERYEWLWVSLAVSLVWITEIINISIEKLTDLISPDYNPLAGKAKDLAAAAVLIAAVFALIVGMVIFLPRFL